MIAVHDAIYYGLNQYKNLTARIISGRYIAYRGEKRRERSTIKYFITNYVFVINLKY
jgi:hypothetical protein